MADEPFQIKCFRCLTPYTGRPSDHVCPDGTTFLTRVSKVGTDAKSHYRYEHTPSSAPGPHDILRLTEYDRKLLKGMKIKP